MGLGLAGCRLTHHGPPDIVVLVLDSLRAKSLPMWGHPRNTAPFLAKLAEQSTLFRRCYAASTWTRPAVTSILSSLPANVHHGGPLEVPYPPTLPSFPRLLGKAGYHTGFFSANVVIGKNFGMESHFSHVDFDPAEDFDLGPRLTDDCEAWLRTLDEHAPTFVYIHYHPPHGPYHPPEPFVDQARRQPEPSLDDLPYTLRGGAGIALAANILGEIPWYQAKRTLSNDLVDYRQRYEANIAFADSLAQGFFEMWERVRGHRHTLLFVTGDHGEALGEHGLMCDHGKLLIDEILHVPLLVHDTARPAQRTVERGVSHLDLGPTILDLANTPQSFGMMNQSLFTRGSPERLIVSYQMDWLGGEGAMALTAGQWRLVYNPGARYGGGNPMAVSAGDPQQLTLTGVPLPLPSTTLRAPIKLFDGDAEVESFALATPILADAETVEFVGSFKTTSKTQRLAVRVRPSSGEGVVWGPFPPGEFTGQISTTDEREAERVIIEAAPWKEAGPSLEEKDWRLVLATPVFSSNRLSEALEILGCKISPTAACPGDSIHLGLQWRAFENVDAGTGVVVDLVSPNGRIVLRETRGFFCHFPSPQAEPRPLIPPGKVVPSTFSENPLDFEDAFWWTLPTSLPPGDYRVTVGLCDLDRLISGGKVARLESPAPAANLKVCRNRSHHLRSHLQSGLGIEDLRLPLDWVPGPGDAPSLRAEALRFPDVGHLDYLVAVTTADEGERRHLLQSCLEKTPRHRPALELLAAAGDEDARREVPELAPSNPCFVDFGNIAKLLGFDLCRGDTGVDVTLYWQAEAVTPLLLAGGFSIPGRSSAKELKDVDYHWFIGGELRPTYHWQTGEVVVETIRLPVDSDTDQVPLNLLVSEYWRREYSGRQGDFLVTSGNGADMWPVMADLGTHRITDLPPCASDILSRKRQNPEECLLIDLAKDPDQEHDRRQQEPAVFARLHRHLGLVLALGDRPAHPATEGNTVELGEDTKEKLRALGYVD